LKKLINISDLSKMLNLIDNNRKPLNYILRYWEEKFNEIKPKKINNRRYYTLEQVEIIKLIKFLLKDKGMTINGVKNVLKSNINKLDDYNSDSLKAEYYRKKFKEKSKEVLNKIKKLKKYGKKNSH
tara:strand:+ start:361 stop:738 length:378 start_codon:yes stop_codon:yes gene_type:complete